ncbi:alpha/beta hydrolase family protein [Promicromonospora sp. NPDC060204]|uniref:alpha/beta hydrolase family protein n=1 Tax=Promicromonospora sp. NPDC060204 TaxID=3347071 RepID=UPI0036661471
MRTAEHLVRSAFVATAVVACTALVAPSAVALAGAAAGPTSAVAAPAPAVAATTSLVAPSALAPVEATPSDVDEPILSLPEPTGRYPVGLMPLHLVDEDRADPWVPEARRELMVSLWYPAVPRGEIAPYTSEAVSTAIIEAARLPVAPDILTTVEAHAYDRAPALPGKRPLVVLSPGASLSRESLMSLAEDLASRGYVVAGIDHTYEARVVELPGDRVAGCLLCERENTAELGAWVAHGRSADIGFVLDELTGGRLGRHAPAIDARRIAVVGHSLGGASAAVSIMDDPRVDAGVNLDGTFQVDFPEGGADRPFLMLGGAAHEPGASDGTDWPDNFARLGATSRWLQVPTANHGSFTDQLMFLDQLGVPLPGGPGTVGGERGVRITSAYVGAFLDRHLRGLDAPLLDGPSPAYPEVEFEG